MCQQDDPATMKAKPGVNPYLPMSVTISAIRDENAVGDLKTFDLTFDNDADAAAFDYVCGQFAMLSIDGAGEAPFGIASSPMDKGVVQFTIKRYGTGQFTTALHRCGVGDSLGLRGPFGNGYPMTMMEGANLLIVGGGFALTTLRSVALYCLHPKNRARYGALQMLVAARDPGEILYVDDLAKWNERDDITIDQAIDRPAEGWAHRVGFAAPVLKEVAGAPTDCYALVCGPPIMIKTCTEVLFELGFPPERIVNSLEMRMKCGIGKCGRCNVGHKYVCKDGPVFTLAELRELGAEL